MYGEGRVICMVQIWNQPGGEQFLPGMWNSSRDGFEMTVTAASLFFGDGKKSSVRNFFSVMFGEPCDMIFKTPPKRLRMLFPEGGGFYGDCDDRIPVH